jgi:hypothetical protein
MKKSEKPKIKITGTAKAAPVPPKKTLKPGSMATSSKNVTVPAVKKATPAAKDKARIADKKVSTAKKSPSVAAKAANVVGKVAGRAKAVAREVRDIPTAVGTAVRATAGRNPGFRRDFAVDQLKKQVKEVKTTAKSGAKGKRSVEYNNFNPNKNR